MKTLLIDHATPNLALWPFAHLALSFPIRDPQFWIATAIFLAALAWLLKGIVPIPLLTKRHKSRRGQTRATLTIGGKPAKK